MQPYSLICQCFTVSNSLFSGRRLCNHGTCQNSYSQTVSVGGGYGMLCDCGGVSKPVLIEFCDSGYSLSSSEMHYFNVL